MVKKNLSENEIKKMIKDEEKFIKNNKNKISVKEIEKRNKTFLDYFKNTIDIVLFTAVITEVMFLFYTSSQDSKSGGGMVASLSILLFGIISLPLIILRLTLSASQKIDNHIKSKKSEKSQKSGKSK